MSNFIQSAIKHPGALHRALGVKPGQKIPEDKMAMAKHSTDPHLRRMANLATTLKRLNHK